VEVTVRHFRAIGALGLVLTLAAGCRANSKKEAARLTGGDPDRGVERIGYYGCGACHSIPGVQGADATVGPSLDRIAVRTYLGGHLANTPANMMKWIQKPQEINKGTAMPEMGVTDQDARDIAAHLYTLR
jgi:cytochrome c2